ncbi:MAG TPA: tRNA 2-selenouridine(34) synthase MnmH [Burkholderiaceae bacterium]|nr:tRNA 2-selenouridine(34) synthase MnmH [Burkholderiaceae bacterium]
MKDPIVLPVDQVVARLRDFNTVLDARSPSEYADDHLPGAVSAPVLDDAERERVGEVNAREGAFEAKRLGAAIASRNIGALLETRFADRDRDWKPLVYCWRGGNRSGSLATVLARVGWRTTVVEGGYKAFRRHVIDALDALPRPMRFLVVGGRTGSAKSRLLERLAAHGEQVLDLERLASHRGSVLGGLPGEPQPSQKRFETMLWDVLRGLDASRPVFVESESRKVGRCQVPEALIGAIRASRLAVVEADVPVRARFLLDEYRHFPEDVPVLLALLEHLVPLHGVGRVAEWKALAERGDWETFVERLLVEHYDPSYDRSMKRNFGLLEQAPRVTLDGTDEAALERAAQALRAIAAEAHRSGEAPRPDA